MKKWMVKGLKSTVLGVAGLAAFSLADNPISSYHYLADPAATADEDYFYIIADSDDPAPANDYDIRVLYAFASKDMKNWTDYGIIYAAKREYSNIGNVWASGIAIGPDKKFHIVYPDGGGGGIGLIESESIAGPYKNPVPDGKKLIHGWGGGITDCDQISWCFDPAIFFDDDGSGYFTVGGGGGPDKYGNYPPRPSKENANNNFNIYKFNSQVNSFSVDSKVQLKLGGPAAMEASHIHKNGNTYYLSYSTTNLKIAYATSDKVTGPYTYRGIFMENPNINGQNINAYNNNHHGIAKFKTKWYAVYHDRRLVQSKEHPKAPNNPVTYDDKTGQITSTPDNPAPAYHRSVSIDEMFHNTDGTLQSLKFTDEGPEQVEPFNPYAIYPALTSSKQRNIRSYTDWNQSDWERGIAAKHILTPYATKESWIRVSGVNFGTEGAKSFKVVASSIRDDNKIEIHAGSPTGTAAGTCTLKKTENQKVPNLNSEGQLNYYDVDKEGKFTKFEENECTVSGLTGEVSDLFIVFKGTKDTTMGVLEWSFTCSGNNCKVSEPQKQTPFGGTAAAVPGLIEAENFDVPGDRIYKSYYETDSKNNGDSDYRTEDAPGVDLYKLADGGIAIGYNDLGEWYQYTFNVKANAKYKITTNVSSGNNTSAFKLYIDDKAITEDISVPQTADNKWDIYEAITAHSGIDLTAGEHVMKVEVTSAFFNIDWIKFDAIDENGNVIEIKETQSSSSGKANPSSSSSGTTSKNNGSSDSKGEQGKNAPAAISGNHLNFNGATVGNFEVYDLKGNKIASFSAKNMAEAVHLWKNGNVKGDVRASGINIIRNRTNGMVTKVRVNY